MLNEKLNMNMLHHAADFGCGCRSARLALQFRGSLRLHREGRVSLAAYHREREQRREKSTGKSMGGAQREGPIYYITSRMLEKLAFV